MATQIEETAPRLPLSRERVLQTAVSLADRDGVDGVSMRKIAQELGVVPMALYKHVAQLLRDLPHADALDPVPIRQGDGGLQDSLPAQGQSGSGLIDLRRHAANLLSSGASAPGT